MTPPTTGHSIRLLQITDCHLGAEPGERLLGMDTDAGFHEVMNLIGRRENHIDWIVASGDIASQGAAPAYHRFLDLMAGHTRAPLAWLPGNHDRAAIMPDLAPERVHSGQVETEHWQILLLDSSVPGWEGGSLAPAELQRLEQRLTQCHKHTLIFVHHQPVPVGSAWVDAYVIDNADALFTLLDRFPQVRGLAFGHVHQAFVAQHRQIGLWATPSTCIQFMPQQEHFAVDRLMPGYRWFDLHPDGAIDTGVERIAGQDFGIDYDSAGY